MRNGFKEIVSTIEDVKRYYAFVVQGKQQNDCWKWTGPKSRKYGSFIVNGLPCYAHRFSFFIHCGFINNDLLVLHRCDNPECTNPFHLFQGTDKQNKKDALDKGRVPRGSDLPHTKLTEKQVMEIKMELEHCTNVELSKRYGVNFRAISDIRIGRTWNHVIVPTNQGGLS